MNSILQANDISTNYRRIGTRRKNYKRKIAEFLMLKYKNRIDKNHQKINYFTRKDAIIKRKPWKLSILNKELGVYWDQL